MKIGNADTLLTGKHLYTIHYTMDMVVFKKTDELNAISFNAIGTGWKVDIKNIKIDINLPQKLQNAKLKFFSGNKGSTSSNLIIKKLSATHYEILKDKLLPHQGITFDIYFNKDLIKVKTLSFEWVYIYIIIFLIALYLYYSKHKIPYIAISPKYYPPKDLDILKVGLLLDQKADEKDISSAILELATKGYLKIETIKETTFKLFTKEVIILKKIKEVDENLDKDEKLLFKAIFPSKKDSFLLGEEDVKTANRLRNTIEMIDDWLYKWGEKNGYLKENPIKAKVIFIIKSVLVMLPFVGYAFYQSYMFYAEEMFVSIMLMVFIGVGIMVFMQEGIFPKLFGLFFVGMGIFISIGMQIQVTPFIISLIPLIFVLYFANKISVYSIKGINKLKYILGLKEFILKVEKDKLEFFLKENPNYLDEMLPYAVLFGANHWFSFYDEFNINKNWYEGESIYFYGLDRELSNQFNHTSNYTESSSSSSSDSFSGGGSVGGGSGGGGGGSW